MTEATVQANATFGVPDAAPLAAETPEQRLARLTALAEAQVMAETDAEMLARLKAEARQRLNPERAQLPTDTQGFPADYDRVTIFKGQSKQDLAYVPLGINGFVIKVPRGEQVIIPHVFTEVLEHAVEDVTIQSNGGLITRPSHRFPFNVHGKATPEEYRAFQASQRALAERQLALADAQA